MQPGPNKVFVAPDDPTRISSGGISIPKVAQEKVTRGRVVSVGEGVYDAKHGRRMPLGITEGDMIHFRPGMTEEIQAPSGEKLQVLDAGHVYLVEE